MRFPTHTGLPSAGRRFLKTLGYALARAALFGTLLGLSVYFRPRRVSLEAAREGLSLRQRLFLPLQALELFTFDLRARALGSSRPSAPRVVLATIDEESLANAREDEHPAVATQPWPRELIARMVNLLADEGATLTLLDLPFPDLSPRGDGVGSDDERFKRLLDKSPKPVVMTFDVSAQAPPPALHPLRPYLARVGVPTSQPQGLELLATTLAQRRPAYAIPRGAARSPRGGASSAGPLEIWTGALTLEEAKALARKASPKQPPEVREFTAQDRGFQVDAVALAVMLAEVTVDGLDPELLPVVRWLKPPAAPLLGQALSLGFRGVFPDADGVVRGIQELIAYVGPNGERHLLPSAPLAAMMRVVGARSLRYDGVFLILNGGLRLPMDDSGFSLLVWDAAEAGSDGRGTLSRAIPAWELLRNVLDADSQLPPHYPGGVGRRAVVLTDTTDAAATLTRTPIGPAVAQGAVLGQSLGNWMDSEGIVRAAARTDAALTFGMAFVGALLALTLSRLVRSFLGAAVYLGGYAAAAVGYTVLAQRLFVSRHLWYAVAAPLVALTATFVATTLYAVRTRRQMREFVEGTLGRYVSPEITRQVFRNVSLMKPERREVSLYVCDLAGFSRLLEKMEPPRLVALLNEYFTEMTAVVRHGGGQVEYVGDAMLGFFGAPVRTERHAQVACETALTLRAALARRRADWEHRFGQRIDFRTGISTGEVLVGDLGSRLKSNYTVMGEPVTLAERLQSANRIYGTDLLAGESTRVRVGDAFVFREVDEVTARGGSLKLFELLGRKGEVADDRLESVAQFEKGLAFYRTRRFTEALVLFQRLEQADSVSRLYVKRTVALCLAPPGPEWKGLGDLRHR